MSSDPNAPIAPPMMSPDGKWVWDGQQWIPVADPSAPAHRSVFAAYDAATRDVPAIVSPPQVAVQMPYTVQPVGAQPAPSSATLWGQRSQTGLSKYLYYIAGGVAAVVVVGIVLQYAGAITWPWNTAAPAAPQLQTVNLGSLAARTDSAQADRYVKSVITPAMADLNDTSGPVEQGCHNKTAVTVSCAAALPPMDRNLKKVLSSIDNAQAQVPPCLAPTVAAVRRDVNTMETSLVAAQAYSVQNNAVWVRNEFTAYEKARTALTADVAAATRITQQTCSQDITGP